VAYLAALVVCLGMVAVSVAAHRHPVFFYNEYKEDGSRLCGIMTLASAFFMMAGGFLLSVSARQVSRLATVRDHAYRWHAAGLGLIYLGFDDLIQIHEWITTRLRLKLHFPGFLGLDPDIYVYLAYGVAAVGLALVLLPELVRYRSPLFPLAAVFVFMAGSQVVDVFFPWDKLSQGAQWVLGPLEEILKCLGAWSATLCGLLFLEELIELRAAQPAMTAAAPSITPETTTGT
jgi:hypothetical protein